ncbi:MAG: hypothetical protein GKR87_09590 [Kiritimatiellae bacterium]|nr:hypothetical protein [Kiritimatiellia bacterium]
MFFIDMDYIIMVFLPGLILGGIATWITKTTFHKYSKIAAASGVTGAEAARKMLNQQELYDVNIEMTQGFLNDHYDPRTKTLRLSPKVYESNSLAAIGVACHEAGHALQHAQQYAPLALRSALVPATQFGSNAAYVFLLLGMIMNFQGLMIVGCILFAVAVVFSIVTLPVEWDASVQAKKCMVHAGIVNEREQMYAGKVLNAAFLTYVAAAVTAILTLLYYLMRSGLLRRD